MRIVKRDEMLKLPAGTVYSLWEPCVSRELFLHRGPCGGAAAVDWYQTSLLPSPDKDFSDNPVLDLSMCREGNFDNKQRYAVYDRQELEQILCAILQPTDED